MWDSGSKLPLVFVLAILGLWGCADLDVTNLNEPDKAQALTSLQDATALISASHNTWFRGNFSRPGPGLFMSQAAFQHSSPWSCSTSLYSLIPRVAFVNDPAHVYQNNLTRPWEMSYAAIRAVSDGLEALEDPALAAQAEGGELIRARAFAHFSLGLSYGTLALLYDQGFRVDETPNSGTESVPLGYGDVMEVAFEYFDEAIRLASGSEFTLPYGWMQAQVSSAYLVQLAFSLKARLRAQMARTPEERASVDWASVIADVDEGIQSDHFMEMDWGAGWYNMVLDYSTWSNWGQLPYFIYGMADQSGDYQEWLELPFYEKRPSFADGRPVLIRTPDLRFPQGSTVEAQRANGGRYYRMTLETEQGNTWKKPENGTWRWSWYKPGPRGFDYASDAVFRQPFITLAEMRLLRAEGLLRQGNRSAAAAIINETRAAAGLSPTDASGSNGSCVPKLPDGSCGDLWEMLKWEKRMETVWTGLANANWWFDGRGWGDLWKGTPLQLPVPCQDLTILGLTPCHTFGGPEGAMGSPGSSYAFPSEQGWSGELVPDGPQMLIYELPPWCDGPQIR